MRKLISKAIHVSRVKALIVYVECFSMQVNNKGTNLIFNPLALPTKTLSYYTGK